MKREFRYSKFYVLQPMCAFVFMSLFTACFVKEAFRPGQERGEIVAWILLISFFLYVIVRAVFRFFKVINDPVLFTIGPESILLAYRKNRRSEIRWEDINKMESRKNPWAIGHEVIEVTLKNGTKRTLCDNFLKQYKAFKLVLSEMSSGKVAAVKL